MSILSLDLYPLITLPDEIAVYRSSVRNWFQSQSDRTISGQKKYFFLAFN